MKPGGTHSVGDQVLVKPLAIVASLGVSTDIEIGGRDVDVGVIAFGRDAGHLLVKVRLVPEYLGGLKSRRQGRERVGIGRNSPAYVEVKLAKDTTTFLRAEGLESVQENLARRETSSDPGANGSGGAGVSKASAKGRVGVRVGVPNSSAEV